MNSLSLREEDLNRHLLKRPEWKDVSGLMSLHGVSSSDAMIINIFLSSKFEALITSDIDIALALLKENLENKLCLVPDLIKEEI